MLSPSKPPRQIGPDVCMIYLASRLYPLVILAVPSPRGAIFSHSLSSSGPAPSCTAKSTPL